MYPQCGGTPFENLLKAILEWRLGTPMVVAGAIAIRDAMTAY